MARDPEDPIESIQHEVERLFHDLVYHRHPASHFSEPTWQPAADLVVSRHAARVLLELAGERSARRKHKGPFSAGASRALRGADHAPRGATRCRAALLLDSGVVPG